MNKNKISYPPTKSGYANEKDDDNLLFNQKQLYAISIEHYKDSDYYYKRIKHLIDTFSKHIDRLQEADVKIENFFWPYCGPQDEICIRVEIFGVDIEKWED